MQTLSDDDGHSSCLDRRWLKTLLTWEDGICESGPFTAIHVRGYELCMLLSDGLVEMTAILCRDSSSRTLKYHKVEITAGKEIELR
jgi:hypothetical protein